MIVVIRNVSGFDLFLAFSADEQRLRIRVSLEAPKTEAHVEKVRNMTAFAVPNCPEGLGVTVRCPRELLYAAKHREVIDRLDEDNELDGEETYLVYTIKLVN